MTTVKEDGISRRKAPIFLTPENIEDFLQSFDTIFTDCDGVLWFPGKVFKNVDKGIEVLTYPNKKILFVSNNSFRCMDTLVDQIRQCGIPNVRSDHCVFPSVVVADHLKTTGFKKKAVVIGSEAFRKIFTEAGIAVEDRAPSNVEENFLAAMRVLQDDLDVGAVIFDVDFNMTWLELSRALTFLRRADCLFYVCATELRIDFANRTLVGPAQFSNILEDLSGRKPVTVGKPSTMMIDFLMKRHHVDPERTLFIGDSLDQDMGVAIAAGFKSLLVLSGLTCVEEIDTCPLHLVPDYVVPDLEHIVKFKA